MSIVSVDRTQSRNYEEHGRRYFSVSQVCRVMTGDSSYGSEADMQRGTDLHAIFALAVASAVGWCAPPVVPHDYRGYYQSMQTWIEAFQPDPLLIERPSVSAMKGIPFAGTPDLLAVIPHRQGKRLPALIDLKSGQKATWHRVQIQAYAKLKDYHGAASLGLLYIQEDGTAPIYEPVKPNPRDFAAFQSALNLLFWRESV